LIPKVTDNITNGINGSAGQKTFDFLLIPRHYGEFIIPPVNYTYFNAGKAGNMKTDDKRVPFFMQEKGQIRVIQLQFMEESPRKM